MSVEIAAPARQAPGADWRRPVGCAGPSPRPAVGRVPGAEAAARRLPRSRTDLDLGQLPGIDLAALADQAALMTRLDRKYLVDLSVLPRLMEGLSALVVPPAALEVGGRRQFGYESLYYDTPTLTSYLQAARRRPHRFKVRARTYLDTGLSFVEVKTRDGRRRTVKARMDVARPDGRWGLQLDPSAQAFVADRLARSVAAPEVVAETLTPTLSTRYRRATLFLPEDAARVTIDVELQGLDRHGGGLVMPTLAIIETKTGGRACAADRLLWRLGQRPIKVSKYATTLAALHPTLPATTWRPALRRIAATPTPRVVPSLLTSPQLVIAGPGPQSPTH